MLSKYMLKLQQARDRRSTGAEVGGLAGQKTAQRPLQAVASAEVDVLERAARQVMRLEVLIRTVQGRFALAKDADQRCQELKAQFRRLLKESFIKSLNSQASAQQFPPLEGKNADEEQEQEQARVVAQTRANVEGCLRAFVSVGELHLAEQLVQNELVEPLVKKLVSAEAIRSDLAGMLDSLKQLVTVQCGPLLSTLLPPNQNAAEDEADETFELRFLEAAVWPEICEAFLAQGHALFPSGIPDTFQRHYALCHSFLADVLAVAPSRQSKQRLLTHPLTAEFRKKWQLAVYFQLRFQALAGKLEAALERQEVGQDTVSTVPKLLERTEFSEAKGVAGAEIAGIGSMVTEPGAALSDCLLHCWAPHIFLPPLSPEFFRLNLQLLSRFCTWAAEGLRLGDGSSSPSPWQEASPASLLGLVHDCSLLTAEPFQTLLLDRSYQACQQALQRLETGELPSVSMPIEEEQKAQLRRTLETGFAPCMLRLRELLEPLRSRVVQSLIDSCGPVLERGVPGLLSAYSMTNRPAPTAPSEYSREIMSPLSSLLEEAVLFLHQTEKESLVISLGVALAELFKSKIVELEANAEKRERMLVRFKGKPSESGADGALTDFAKMRLQLQLDVNLFSQQLKQYGGEKAACFKSLLELQEQVKSRVQVFSA
eukprot:gb/GEZN01001707.1/.p1 GENE.gb/GEZN01001707.1/~~gb/GEZN01001707.1/.p1  ORF type:complete len:655 (+),score=132.70 gb/GEZN01001707.1/:707-2671(+)